MFEVKAKSQIYLQPESRSSSTPIRLLNRVCEQNSKLKTAQKIKQHPDNLDIVLFIDFGSVKATLKTTYRSVHPFIGLTARFLSFSVPV